MAIKNDNASLLSGLLDRGFDPNTRDPKGQPGLTMALQERSPKALKALLDRRDVDINALNQAGESPLMMAALKGDVPAAQQLLERGAKVNQSGWAPLHYAATGPETRLVQLLLERGAEINAPSPNGTTPLMMAAQYGTEDSVRLLLERGADASRRNDRGMRAADFAKLSGREPVIKRLEQAAPR
ncbi:ankyrin repeat domain-containing protein [Rhizobacter sp. Root404]|uniref:ankyrin repeat domain-containing protein n=1 Tax=Rhizobacter sp. Root404 TaxID=1736528 RepID=UPI001F43EEB3|nr:ankyrin repeat domain-containing protein [Rhizobacter sp. Root404]